MAAKIGKTVGDSQPFWPEGPKRPTGLGGKGAPNILVVLFDDVGFSGYANGMLAQLFIPRSRSDNTKTGV